MKNAKRLWRILIDENGQVLVLGTVLMATLMGVMALAVDVGYIRYRQVQLQTAADAAAVAAGLELGNCNKIVCQNMETAAEKALIEDGITGSTITPTTNCSTPASATLTMTINDGPCALATDPNYGISNMVEVVLTEKENLFFANTFHIPIGVINLQARAEGGEAYTLSNGGGNCIYTKSIQFNSSNGVFTLNNCGIYDSGNLQTDNGDQATASTFLYYGTWQPNNCNGSCKWTLGGGETQPTNTKTLQSDPLSTLTQPTKPATSTTNTQTPSNGATLQPGYYPNGFNLNSNVSVTLAPGVYYLGNSIDVDAGATLSGTGVTLYFASGSLQPNSSTSVVNITAPTTSTNGDNANMAVWESNTNSTGMDLDANTSTNVTGIIYLPDATLTLNSGSSNSMNSTATATALDVNGLIVNSGITFNINGSGGYLGGGAETLGAYALVE